MIPLIICLELFFIHKFVSVLEGSIAKIIQMKEKSLSYLGLELSFRVSKFKFYFRICCVIWRNNFPPNTIYISIKTIFSGTWSWMCLHVQITIFSQILCNISTWFLICQNCRAQFFFFRYFFDALLGFVWIPGNICYYCWKIGNTITIVATYITLQK